MKIQLKRSNVIDGGSAKEPTPAQMEYGELAVNYSGTDPALFIKDEADNIVRIAGAGSAGGQTPGDGTITIKQPGIADQTFSVNQSGPTEINLLNDNTVSTPGDGALTVRNFGDSANSTGTFTANQSSGSVVTLPQIKYANISGTPTIPTVGNGALTIKTFGHGASATGSFTANQSGAGTLTLPKIRYQDIDGAPAGGDYLRLDSGAGNQTILSTGTVTNRGKFEIGPSSGVTRLEQISSREFDIKPTVAASFVRIRDNESNSTSIQFALGDNANSGFQVSRVHQVNPGSSQAYPKVVLARADLRSANVTGGSSNALNAPATFAASIGFNSSTRATTYSLFNCQNITSDNPGTTNNWPELIGFNLQNQAIGYNDGTNDISLKNTKIVGYNTNIANDGSCGGSTNVWSIYSNGDAPLWHRGTLKVNNGLEFNGNQNSVSVNANLALNRYEKGTFTPGLEGSSTGPSISSAQGWYQICGNLCTVMVNISYTGASGNGQIVINNMPLSGDPITGSNAGVSGAASVVDASTAFALPIIARVASANKIVLINGGARTQNTSGAKVKFSDIPQGTLRVMITYSI